MQGPLIDKHQLAKLLGVSVRTIEDKTSAREIPFTRPLGTNRIRYSEQDVDDIIAAGRETPAKTETRTRIRKPRSAA